MTQLKKISFAIVILSIALVSQVYTQEEPDNTKKVNFGYSTNPPAKKPKKSDNKKEVKKTDETIVSLDSENKEPSKVKTDPIKVKQTPVNVKLTKPLEAVSIAKKTIEITKKASKANLLPSEIYKVGIGDVLFINLQDTAAKYYTVLIDGTIDYPLAGKLVSVVELTTEEIEDLLREKVKLYENPQVTVKIREYASHKIQVQGLARVGEHYLQREAMPLVVVKTMVGVKSDATKVTIEREKSEPKVFSLNDSNADAFLIEKGDQLIFEDELNPVNNTANTLKGEFYFVGEKICSGGKQKYHKGITLVQAVFEVCGKLNKRLKEVSVLRKTASGVFVTKKYKFKEILSGKQTDPLLQPGDMIDSEK